MDEFYRNIHKQMTYMWVCGGVCVCVCGIPLDHIGFVECRLRYCTHPLATIGHNSSILSRIAFASLKHKD